nr:hypothetical protein [uncultured Pseudomonas sp.]
MKITNPYTPVAFGAFQASIATPNTVENTESSSVKVEVMRTRPTVNVAISVEGKQKVDEEKYADIDKAALPEDVKEALKNIRKLQERMAEKRQEIQEIMQDDSLSEETKKSRKQAAIAELEIMQAAMSDAQNALNTRLSQHNLGPKERALAKGLVGMK